VLLDFKTLSLLMVISSFLYTITISFLVLHANQYNGIKLYMWGTICAAGGFLAGVLSVIFPEFFAPRFAASSFFVLACYFYCLGIARFLNFNFNWQGLFYFLVLGITAIGYFIFFNTENGIIKILISFFYAIVFYSIACYLLWQRRHENFASSLYFMLVSLIFIILIFIVHSYIVMAYHVESLIQNKLINSNLLLAVFISAYLRNVGFIMMVAHRLYQDLREVALQDFLTNVCNRRAIHQRLEQQFNLFQRYHSNCSLIFVDIDYFKTINDNYGHETGDKVLQMVAILLKTQLRKTDTLGRWGGEEFLILLPNTRVEKALEVAEKLRNEIAKEEIAGIACTVSLGVKMLDDDDHSIDEAIKRADDALYRAKNKGRNCVVAYI
jgi:diguanylate cyclase (GGDEF)-like protein